MSFACATFEGWEDARTVYLGHVIVAWMRSAGRTLEFWVVPSFSDIVSLTSGGYPIFLCRFLAAYAVSFHFVNLASLSVTDCAYCRSLQIAKSHTCSLLSYQCSCLRPLSPHNTNNTVNARSVSTIGLTQTPNGTGICQFYNLVKRGVSCAKIETLCMLF